jgi:hypothetical protein
MKREVKKTSIQLRELIGYNKNRDSDLEYKLGCSLKDFILDKFGFPEECLKTMKFKTIYNSTTGQAVVEWDEILLVDYTELLSPEVEVDIDWPPQDTMIVLEAKEKLDVEEVFPSIPTRLLRTFQALNSTENPPDEKVSKAKAISNQREHLPTNPSFIVAIGGNNVHGAIEKNVTDKGYLAVGPSGEDYEVASPGKFIVFDIAFLSNQPAT